MNAPSPGPRKRVEPDRWAINLRGQEIGSVTFAAPRFKGAAEQATLFLAELHQTKALPLVKAALQRHLGLEHRYNKDLGFYLGILIRDLSRGILRRPEQAYLHWKGSSRGLEINISRIAKPRRPSND